MQVKEAIKKRRSIRKYQDKEISQEIIDELIEAARLAPSGNNIQPWKFKIIKDREVIEKLRKEDIFKQDFVYNAPLIIVCCADPDLYLKVKPSPASSVDDLNELRAVRDLSIACQNMVLRAVELGLGSCYIGWMEKEKIKQVLDIPMKFVAPYSICFGYSDEDSKEKKKKSKEEILL